MSAQPAFPTIRVGDPIRHEAITVFPLFRSGDAAEGVDYLLSDEAIAAGAVTVEEVGESGSVPTLLVTNPSEHRVLFLEGEELRGAKQNRVLNTSLLIGAKTKTKIPVSCVEQGRWRRLSRHFTHSGSHSSSKMRLRLKESVTRSLKAGHGHHSDQGSVWTEVTRLSSSMKVDSPTMAMSDTYDHYRHRLDEFRAKLPYVEGATGLAVAVGPKVVAIDVFDKPATCRKVWDRLLSGFIMDALEEGKAKKKAAKPDEVEAVWKRLEAAPWEQAPAVGEGKEFRADADPVTHASALTFGPSLIHGSAVIGVAD